MSNLELFLTSGSAFLGGGIGAAALEWWRDKSKTKASVDFLAMRLAFLFEEYTVNSCDKLQSHFNAYGSGGLVGDLLSGIPDIEEFPESNQYKNLKQDLLINILDFPLSLKIAKNRISYESDFIESDILNDRIERETIHFIKEALGITKRIREEYQVLLLIIC